MRQIRRQRCNRQVPDIRIPIPLRSIHQHLLPLQSFTRRPPRLRLIRKEKVRVRVDRVDAVVPPLCEVFIGALKPAGKGVRCTQVSGPFEVDGGDGDAAEGGCVGGVFGNGIEGDADVAEAVEAVGADLGVVLAADVVFPVVSFVFNSDLY